MNNILKKIENRANNYKWTAKGARSAFIDGAKFAIELLNQQKKVHVDSVEIVESVEHHKMTTENFVKWLQKPVDTTIDTSRMSVTEDIAKWSKTQ